ncbi:DUF2283 domain-containing protein [Caulobacter sp. UNC358MFTsu5.1]|uniref:DUF2283 domain-containing protein n=1 Tax=Caulobacter sp. UNC358MFTsu5.1 TaxID=1449049 RepID=UPI0018CC06CF|nr:DUF2283 domain-containing protein [Caulobacter sp. UNC358MFTsu5.1]
MKRPTEHAITGWKAILLAPILIPVGLIAQLWSNGEKLDRTPEEVAKFLRDFLAGTSDEWGWDGFETTPIKDPELDWVRKRAAMAAPPNPDLAVLRDLLTETEQIIEQRAGAAPIGLVQLFRDSAAGASYLTLPLHPGRGTWGCVANTIPLDQIIEGYKGPDVNLDFDAQGRLIGIEVLAA